jgi:lysophospholipase L1-like esterase
MLIRFKPDVLDLEPSLIFLLAGTNDIAGNTGYSTIKMITDNLFSMAELAKVNGIKVVLSSILPVYNYPWNENIIKPYKTISKINNLMKDYVHKNSLLYIDYFSNMVNNKEGLKSEYTTDGVHPSEEGYKVMSKIANNFILRNLN